MDRQSFTGARPPHGFVGLSFDGHGSESDTKHLRKASPHGGGMRCDPGAFTDHSDIHVADAVPGSLQDFDRARQKVHGIRTLPVRVVRRKVLADIPGGGGPEQGIGNSMCDGVSIRVSGEARVIGDHYTPEH